MPRKTPRKPVALIGTCVTVVICVTILSVFLSFTEAPLRTISGEKLAQTFYGNQGTGGGNWQSRSSKSSSSTRSGSSRSAFVSSSNDDDDDDDDHSSNSSIPHNQPSFSSLPSAPLIQSAASSFAPVAPIRRIASSSQPPERSGSTELGCSNGLGQWTMNRYDCVQSIDQAEILGLPAKSELLSDEDFRVVAAEIFRDAHSAHGELAVRDVRELIGLTMQRIDDLLAQPGSPLLVEAALETRNWLDEQYQTLTPQNAAAVADEVPHRIRVMESRTLFVRIDVIKDKVWNAFHVFNQEAVALPLEDLFSFQNAVTAVDNPACRYEGSSCGAIAVFIDTVQHVHGSMENAAVVQGKPRLLDLLQ